MRKLSFLEGSLKYGVIMGLGLCGYTTLMWLTRLDTTYLSIGQYLDVAIIVWPVVMITLAIRKENEARGVTLLKRFGIAIVAGLISFIVYDPFLWLYHHVINPEWFDAVLQLKEQELTAVNAPPVYIAEQLTAMKNSGAAQAGMFRLPALIASVLVLPSLIALVTLAFIRKRQQPAG